MAYTHHYESPLGGILLASDGEAITGLWFDGQRHFGQTLASANEEKALPVFTEAEQWLTAYFAGENPKVMPELSVKTSKFREQVWRILKTIPYGETMTYGQIAGILEQESGCSVSARAVGGAVAHNPISLMIPCHRVVGRNGNLTGYAGGIDRKIWLLKLERVDMTGFYLPCE